MKTLPALFGALSLAVLGFLSTDALAQDPEVLPLPPPATAPLPVPPAPVAAAAPAAGVTQCLAGDYAGVDAADARTTFGIVCAEIAKQGPTPGITYRVGLGKLGSVIILSIQAESPPNTIVDYRQLQLSSIEEIPIAAPRVVDALLHNKKIEETQKVDNIVGAEARSSKKKSGSMRFGLGIVGVFPPLSDSASPGMGLVGQLMYETSQLAIGFDMRFAVGGQDKGKIGYFSTTVGGRYYLSDSDVAPYVAAGLGPTYLQLDQGYTYSYANSTSSTSGFKGDKWGFSGWGEVGVEFLRTHKSQLLVGFRADVPFFSLDSNTYTNGNVTKTSRYYLPLSLNATFKFP